MWLAVWLATVAASGLAVFGSWQLASETFEASLEESLEAQMIAQAGTAALPLDQLPVARELATDEGAARVQARMRALRDASGLRDIALITPDGRRVPGSGATTTASAGELALIGRARTGHATAGPPYERPNGAVYLAAYAPLPSHEGWVVTLEGSGAQLEVAEEMETILAWGSALVLLVSAVAGGLLAMAATRPLGRLARDLGSVQPGDPPTAVALGGPAEVRLVASAARALLQAVRERDEALRVAHDREVHQISALAAAVAHEVRNPLNAIGLAIQRLDRVRVSEAAALRERVRNLLADIEGIVERFMDLSRPPEPDLQRVRASAIWGDLSVDADAVGVELVMPASDHELRTDASLVRQALRNLIRNAAEAGAKTVTLRVARERPMVLEVSDDGPGIPPEQRDRLFDWFHTTRAQGVGLGLPSARRALRAIGGGLELIDPVGAVFRVTLEGDSP